MRRYVLCLTLTATGLLAGGGASAQQSQYPVFTVEAFESTMKTVGQNYMGTTQALAKGDHESAKALAIRSREQLATTITFWRKNNRDDAVKMLKAVTAKFDELDDLLSKTPVDKDAALATAKQIGGACQACHTVYREQDPATKAYRIKLAQ